MPDLSQGAQAKLILQPGEVYRISAVGTATVQAVYGAPSGTTTVTSKSQDFGPYDAHAKLIITAVSGPVNYQIRQGLSPVLVDDEYRLLGPDGRPIGYGGASRPVIAGFGDSFLNQGWYGWLVPWARDETTTLPGIQFVGMERKVGSGAHTLNYRASDRSCSFDGGAYVALVDGFQIIPGPADKTGCGIIVRTVILSAANGSLACTRKVTQTRPDEIAGGNSSLYWMNVFAGQGYVVRGYGHTGGWTIDGLSIIARSEPFDAFILNYHTNDIEGGSTLAQLQQRTIALLDAAYAKSRAKVGIINGCCPFRSGWSTAKSEIADAYNRWLPSLLKSYPGVVARYPWVLMISEAGNAANTLLMNGDNIHPDDPMAQIAGKQWADYFGIVLPGTPIDFGAALGVYSATNPGGNRLLNPHPAGNNSGRPTGWNALAAGTGGATASKVARTDGVPGEWARITGNATADNVEHSFTIPQAMFVGAPANGDIVQAFVEVRCSGAGQMLPYLILSDAKDATVVYCRANRIANKALQITEWTGVMALPPYEWSDTAGTPTVDLRVGQRPVNGASGVITDFGRALVCTPEEFSIF